LHRSDFCFFFFIGNTSEKKSSLADETLSMTVESLSSIRWIFKDMISTYFAGGIIFLHFSAIRVLVGPGKQKTFEYRSTTHSL